MNTIFYAIETYKIYTASGKLIDTLELPSARVPYVRSDSNGFLSSAMAELNHIDPQTVYAILV